MPYKKYARNLSNKDVISLLKTAASGTSQGKKARETIKLKEDNTYKKTQAKKIKPASIEIKKPKITKIKGVKTKRAWRHKITKNLKIKTIMMSIDEEKAYKKNGVYIPQLMSRLVAQFPEATAAEVDEVTRKLGAMDYKEALKIINTLKLKEEYFESDAIYTGGISLYEWKDIREAILSA